MIDFNEFNDWVPIFKGGIRQDTLGREHDGNRIIDRAIKSFNPSQHEPPLTIGKVKDSSPAFGWVKALKTTFANGEKTLFAKIRQVHPALTTGPLKLKDKRFGVSVYKDGRLRRVALQGVTPPSIPVLENVNHNDGGEGMTFEFVAGDEKMDPGRFLQYEAEKLFEASERSNDFTEAEMPYHEAFLLAAKKNPSVSNAYFDSFCNSVSG